MSGETPETLEYKSSLTWHWTHLVIIFFMLLFVWFFSSSRERDQIDNIIQYNKTATTVIKDVTTFIEQGTFKDKDGKVIPLFNNQIRNLFMKNGLNVKFLPEEKKSISEKQE